MYYYKGLKTKVKKGGGGGRKVKEKIGQLGCIMECNEVKIEDGEAKPYFNALK